MNERTAGVRVVSAWGRGGKGGRGGCAFSLCLLVPPGPTPRTLMGRSYEVQTLFQALPLLILRGA